ncbi:MAG: hypothetical protein QOD06_1411 [Candidatus Binatota bacterium]|nr:hypothetical protein [Candidatus Binatota bacterium]
MDFAFTPEHDELRQTVRRFLDKESSETAVRAVMESDRGYDERTWTRMAEEMALPGLSVPEEYGGAGLGPIERAIVMEEMGRVLFCGPYLSTAVVAADTLLLAGDDDARGRLLPEIASGRALVTLALGEEGGAWEPADVRLEAHRDGASHRLEGTKEFVVDGHVADVLLVAARMDAGVALFEVDAGARGLERTLLPTLDLTRKLARIRFSGTSGRRIGSADAAPQLAMVLARALAALAAEQAGGAERCLEMATDYARTRLQFGRAIGSFQAIKHKCADMLVEVEFARSAAYYAAFRAADEDAQELASASHMAKAYCSEAFFHAAADNIQIHGGMGFTWEHPAHLYFKRARASSVLFGDPVYHRERLAARIGV